MVLGVFETDMKLLQERVRIHILAAGDNVHGIRVGGSGSGAADGKRRDAQENRKQVRQQAHATDDAEKFTAVQDKARWNPKFSILRDDTNGSSGW